MKWSIYLISCIIMECYYVTRYNLSSIIIYIYMYPYTVYGYIYVYICIYIYLSIYLYLSMYLSTYIYLHLSIYIYLSTSIYASVQVNGIPYRMCRSSILPVTQRDLYASCIGTIVTSTLKIQAIRRQRDSRMWYSLVIISHSLATQGNSQVLRIYASFTASWCMHVTSFLIHDSFRL